MTGWTVREWCVAFVALWVPVGILVGLLWAACHGDRR